jgi:hypothetical protein
MVICLLWKGTYFLRRARQRQGMIARILSQEGANAKVMATFYKAVVQSVLLYFSESWVLSEKIVSSLRSFHRRCSRFITGRHIKKNADGSWSYPGSKESLELAGLWTIEEYIGRRKSTVMEYAKERPIYRRCLASKALASRPNQLVWWTNGTSTDA